MDNGFRNPISLARQVCFLMTFNDGSTSKLDLYVWKDGETRVSSNWWNSNVDSFIQSNLTDCIKVHRLVTF